MPNITSTSFDITREEILNLAAQKLTDQYADLEHVESLASRLVRERIEKVFSERLNAVIEKFLADEMVKIISTQVTPVDIWGEKIGQPTTIRAQLMERAKVFWDVKVNSEGKTETYGGKPRHEWLFQQIVHDEFKKAVKENAELIVAAFKDALIVDAVKFTKEHIEKLIPTPRR